MGNHQRPPWPRLWDDPGAGKPPSNSNMDPSLTFVSLIRSTFPREVNSVNFEKKLSSNYLRKGMKRARRVKTPNRILNYFLKNTNSTWFCSLLCLNSKIVLKFTFGSYVSPRSYFWLLSAVTSRSSRRTISQSTPIPLPIYQKEYTISVAKIHCFIKLVA